MKELEEILYEHCEDLTDVQHIKLMQALTHLIAEETNTARIDELERLLDGDDTLGGSLLRVPDHPDDVKVTDVSSEWLADELNYRPRRAIRAQIADRLKELRDANNS